jgi:hypothetical protein
MKAPHPSIEKTLSSPSFPSVASSNLNAPDGGGGGGHAGASVRVYLPYRFAPVYASQT